MDIEQIIDYLMPRFRDAQTLIKPNSIEEAKHIVDKHREVSCLVIQQKKASYTFEEIFCENRSCLDRSKNVFNGIKNIIIKYYIPVNGVKFIFHFKGDSCNINAINFPLLSNSRKIGNSNIILWPLLMKNEYLFKNIKYNPIFHDEINRFLQKPDTIEWENKKPYFIFRGRNSGNPFSCTQYPWDKERHSRCDLLLEYLNLPESLANKVDIGFNELYPKYKDLNKNINNIDYLNEKFSSILKEGKTITSLQNEIRLVFNYLKPAANQSFLYQYKYIICPEGFDCSSALCWVLASNSIAIAPPFHYENMIINSQYLKPYVHFLPIKEDYSDLREVMEWAMSHDEACKEIISNANTYMQHFLNESSMLLIQKSIIEKLVS